MTAASEEIKTPTPGPVPDAGTAGSRTPDAPTVMAATAVLVLLVGVTWDIAWHVDVGRDTFFTPPHWLIVGGIGLLGSAALCAVAKIGSDGDRIRAAVTARPGMVLTGCCAALMLVGLGIDNWWHGVFGIDVSLWSPPHVALLTLGLMAAVGVTADRAARPAARQWAVAVYAGAAHASGMVMLAEYDHGIPHFALYWSGPAMAAVLGAGLGLAARASRSRWAGAIATATAFGLTAAAAGFVLAAGRSVPTVHPSVILAGAVFDLVRRRHRTASLAVLAESAALAWLAAAALEWPWLHLAGRIWWTPPVAAVTIGLGLGAAMAATVVGAGAGTRVSASRKRPQTTGPLGTSARPRPAAIALAVALIGLATLGAAGSRRTPPYQTLQAHLAVHGRAIALTVPGASPQDWASIWHWEGAQRGQRWQAGLSPTRQTFEGHLPRPNLTTMMWLIHRGSAWSGEGDLPDGFDGTVTLTRVRSQPPSPVGPWLTPLAYLLVGALVGCGIVATDMLLRQNAPPGADTNTARGAPRG
jgi:hypothetical protein